MARGRNKSYSTQGQRVASPQRYRARQVLDLDPYPLQPLRLDEALNPLSDIEDRRRFGFSDQATPRSLGTAPPRLKVRAPTPLNRDRYASLRLPSAVSFQAPQRLAICIRRKIRKQVLHALQLTRKGAGSGRRHNFYSGVSC